MTFAQGYSIVFSLVVFITSVIMSYKTIWSVRHNPKPNFMTLSAICGWVVAMVGWELLVCITLSMGHVW